MVFHSLEFGIFLPVVFTLYWLLRTHRYLQNIIIVGASLFFYGWWDWRFLWLILFSSFLDYFVGIALNKLQEQNQRKLLLTVSIIANLSLLGFFKYYNFFIDSFNSAFTILGAPISVDRLHVVLPVGISFYTFQTMSYTIDVYRKQLEPTKDVVSFLAFVSFFPQLVAGPIERATNLLPQFLNDRSFSFSEGREGIRQILWGLFKKVAVADTCGMVADEVFNNYNKYNGSILYIGALCFSIQIYADFSAYSDIAIGSARLFGFRLMQNFRTPYFSANIAEFWNRWHISLSTWFRDYVYIPLGGNRVNRLRYLRNISIVFLVSGLWHGANWTFITWGAIHAFLFLPIAFKRQKRIERRNEDSMIVGNSWGKIATKLIKVFVTFQLVLLAWVIFRSPTIMDSWNYLTQMVNVSFFDWPVTEISNFWGYEKPAIIAVIALFATEWASQNKTYPLETIEKSFSRVLRWFIYIVLCATIAFFSKPDQSTQFIYFQF